MKPKIEITKKTFKYLSSVKDKFKIKSLRFKFKKLITEMEFRSFSSKNNFDI